MGDKVASDDEPGPERITQTSNAATGSKVNQAGRDVTVYGFHLHVPPWAWAAVSVSVLVAAAAVAWVTWQRPTAGPSALDPDLLTTTTTTTTMATATTAAMATTTTTPSPASSEATATSSRPPSATTTPAPPSVTVWWTGDLKLGGFGGTGGGWWLDQNPPGRAVTGDLYYQSENEVAGVALVKWDQATPPDYRQCAGLLDTRRGQAWTAVRQGTTACLRTRDDRVGYFTVTRTPGSNELNASISVTATVWDVG